MPPIKLTPTSYIVLGLVETSGPSTPYDLKRQVALGLGNFWSLQHTQLYTEPERLAAAGYLHEDREEAGRRRKRYTLAPPGRAALRDWLAEPSGELPELRDIGLLKLFFGGDPAALADVQLAAHQAKLHEYEELERQLAAAPEAAARGPLAALRAGIAHEHEWVRFWAQAAKGG